MFIFVSLNTVVQIGRGFTEGLIAYLLPIHITWMIKSFMNWVQVRLLNDETTDLASYYSIHNKKRKFLICDLLFNHCVKDPNGEGG